MKANPSGIKTMESLYMENYLRESERLARADESKPARPDRAQVEAALDGLINEASSGEFAEYGRGGRVAAVRAALLALIFPEDK